MRIRFKLSKGEKILVILLFLVSFSFNSFIYKGSLFFTPELQPLFYSIKKYRFLIYAICFIPTIYLLIRGRFFYVVTIFDEGIEVYSPLLLIVSYYKKLKRRKLKVKFNEIIKTQITEEEIKIFYLHEGQEQNIGIPKKGLGFIPKEDQQFIINKLNSQKIQIEHMETKQSGFADKINSKIINTIINIGLMFILFQIWYYLLLFSLTEKF